MYRLHNRISCSDCHEAYIDVSYTNHLGSLGHINNVRKNRSTLSYIEHIDPNILVDKIRKFHEKLFKSKGDCVDTQMMKDELLTIEAKTRQE